MIFPIGDEQIIGGYKPIFSYSFISLNVFIFFYELYINSIGHLDIFLENYGAIPVEIKTGQDLHTLFTNMFLHGGWMHLIGNMLFLWIFADNIEAIIGNIRFLIFYIAGGIIATLVHVAFNLDSVVPGIGASGAISAVLGAYLVMFPKSRVKILVIYIFSSFYVSAFIFLGFWIIFQLFNGINSMGQNINSGGVAYWAHIGGFSFGMFYGFWARKFYNKSELKI